MLVVDSGKIYYNNKEISNELFALIFKDASEDRVIEIDLDKLTIKQSEWSIS